MDNLEHVRSSSSPSVKVSGLEREGTDGSVLRVRLDDGSLFLLEDHHPLASQLFAGAELDEEGVALLGSASDQFQCRRKALALLARSEQCRRGLLIKLSKKGYSRDSINTVLDKLEDSAYLDDRRFAETWVRSRLRSQPEGPSKLRTALMSKGINGQTARDAVETIMEELGDEEAEHTLHRAWEKLSRRSSITDEKMIATLVRRGFPVSRVRSFLKEKQSEHQSENADE